MTIPLPALAFVDGRPRLTLSILGPRLYRRPLMHGESSCFGITLSPCPSVMSLLFNLSPSFNLPLDI